jgi:hypothetical protein
MAVFPPRLSRFESESCHVGLVDKAALWHFLSQNFGFLCQSFHCQCFHRLLHSHHYPLYGAVAIRQIVADVPIGLSFTPIKEKTNIQVVIISCPSFAIFWCIVPCSLYVNLTTCCTLLSYLTYFRP